MLVGENPNSLTDAPIIHRLSGGLSTVIAFPQSDDPKKNASQFIVPD